ncbi:uncharacterized protein LOC9636636 [Selaginella moellendorffii]|nr:uncharacterized protein LOC9636636 [Selaginella moellendorffii]|eukprot:XP_002988233.2 uncharacterized protein LOC9636636 [Selaginella moellendorffii]
MAMVLPSASPAAATLGVLGSFHKRTLATQSLNFYTARSLLRFEPLSAQIRGRSRHSLIRAAASSTGPSSERKEEVFFDGGPHYGDLVANLVFGFTLFWLPLTVAAVFRALFLRYRFTTYRVTILSGLTGGDRKDFKYDAIKDVKYVPRFIGEWGDVVITLKDDTKVELKSLPRFREIAKFCLDKSGVSGGGSVEEMEVKKRGFS